MAYVRNLKKSFEYLVKDLSEDYAPNTVDAGRTISRTIQDSRKFYNKSGSMNSMKRQIMNTPVFKDIRRSTTKYFKDIKKGNVYKGKDAGFEDEFGLSNVNDMIYDDSDEMPTSESSEPSESSGRTNIDTTSDKEEGLMSRLRQGDSIKDTINDSETPGAVIDSNEALALSLGDVMQALHIDNKIATNIHFDKLDGKLGSIKDNLTTLVKFNDEIQKDFIDKTTTFYEDHMSVLTEIRSILHDNVVIEDPMAGMGNQNTVQKTIMDLLRERNYKGAGQNALFSLINAFDPSGSLASMASLAPMMLQEYVANPSLIFKDITKKGLNKMLGFDVIEKIDGLFDRAKTGKNNLFNKMSLSDNKLVKMLGDTFRDKGDINRTIETGEYNKGRTFFDGITKKAITEVIPTYLRKILSTLSGNEELVYNYDTGQYKNVSEVAQNFYDMRPDFKGQYERIASLVETNLDKDKVGEIDSKALQDTMTKITDNLLDRSYTIDDLSVMKYDKFINMTGMDKSELSRSEYQLIRNALMQAKSGTDQSSASEFRDIQNLMGRYNVDMTDYYKEQSKTSHMTGINTLIDGSFRSQSYGINGIGDTQQKIPEDDKKRYKTLGQYDETRNRGDLSEIGNPFDINMSEKDKRVLEESYDKLNTMDYLNASLMGITNLPFLDKIGINDIKEIKEWKSKNPYDIDNIVSSGGKNIDEMHNLYMDNKIGRLINKVSEEAKNMTEHSQNIKDTGKEQTSKIEDEVTKQLSRGISNIFKKVNEKPESNPAVKAIKGKDDGWDVFKDYKPNVMKGLDFGAGALGGIGIGAIASTILTGSPFMGTIMSSLIAMGGGFLTQNSKLKAKLFGEKNKDKSMVTNISEKFFGKERTDKLHQSIMDIYNGFKNSFITPLGDWFKRTFEKPINWVKGKLGFGNKDAEDEEKTDIEEVDEEVKMANEEEEYGEGINRVRDFYNQKSNRAIFGRGIHFYSQASGEYASLPLQGGSTVGESGCGLLAAAMAVSNILDVEITPDELVNIAKKYKVKDDGISFGFFRDVGYRFNIPTKIFSREEVSLEALENIISNGAMVVSLYEDKSGSLHYVLVRNGKQKYFAVDDPMRGSNLNIPKFLIYGKSRNFIVFYPDIKDESKSRDGELKNANTIKEFFGGIAKNNPLAKKISNTKIFESLSNLSGKISNSTMESVLDDIKRNDNVVDIKNYKKNANSGVSSSDGDGTDESDESSIEKYTKKIIRKQEELLNGVAYNIEYIKRLLISHLGDLDDSLKPDKEGLFGGVFKKRHGLILKIKNFFGDIKDKITAPFNDFGKKIKSGWKSIKETITKPFTFLKNIPSKIKDIFPTKEEIKDKWQEYTEKIKDFSETLYLYGLEYKDKLKDFGETLYLHGLEYKDKLKDFGETLYLHGLEFWDKWKEDIYPSVKESLTDFKERGKEFFNSAKEMVSSGISKLWGGIKSVGRWGIDKLGNIKDKFSNKAGELTDKMFKKGLQKVYVEGGHLDTVGAIGANDLDYFEEVRKKSESKENSNTEDKDINFKSINHASVMDKYQDEGTPAEKKSHSLLKEIAEKEGGSSGEGSGSGDSLSEEVKDWLLAGSSGLSLFAALKEKIANSGVGQSISGGIQNAKIGGKLYMDQAKDFFTNGGINNMWQSGKQMASSGISGISNMWHSGKQMATNAGSSIKNWFTGIGGGLSGLYASTKAGILGAGSSIASWAGTAVGSAGIGTIIGTVMAGAAIGILIGLYLQRFIYDDVETMEDAWNKFKDGAGALVDPKVWKYIGETIKKYFVGEKSELEQMISFIENNDKLSDEQKKKYIRTLIERQAKYTEESVIDKVTKDFEEKYSDGSDDKNTDDLIRSANEKDNKKDSSRNNNTSSGSTSGSGPGSLLNTGSFVNQMSSRYNDLYVGGRKFSENGCAPSVMSMLLSNYGKNIPIDTLTKEANRYSSNRGVDLKYFKDTLEKYNIAGRTQTTDITGLVSRLNDNEQAVLLTKSRDGNGHYVLVKKSNNKLTLFDPLKGNRKTISINDQAIKNASLAYVTEPNLNTNEMLNLNGYQTRIGAGVGAGVDLLTGQRRDRINQLVDNQRLNQLNKIRDLKDRVKIGRQIEREINNTISNKTKTESLNYIGVDNSRIEKKLDTLITEIKKLADVFVNVGKEIVNNSNTNNVVSKQNTNNINNSNEERIDENVRDVFIDTITRISSGVLT